MSDKNFPKIPRKAYHTRLPIGGTLILVLWQRSFPWPSWVYAVIWTLWSLLLCGVLFAIWRDVSDDVEIDDIRWKAVFK